ncbi:MAG: DUF1501 domain-containing protein [Planctomycetes bacterium]|nr:DUF1501 domain-containing protein [Planctomycetota bacterium]
MNDHDLLNRISRRRFLQRGTMGLGMLAMSRLFGASADGRLPRGLSEGTPHGIGMHHAAKAKRVIYLFQSGGPSQLETFDHKPLLQERNGEQLPDSVRKGQRLTGMSGHQTSLPLAGAQFKFEKHGPKQTWVSELLPYTAQKMDKLCLVRSMHTEAINHDPAITFFLTGSQIAGRPSMGSWLSYGLGSDNKDLPDFVVLVTKNKGGQPLYARLWGSGFLPSLHQGVQFRAEANPVLFLKDLPGIQREDRRRVLDAVDQLAQVAAERSGDPEVNSRMAQAEMAYRMQMSVPEATDISKEPDSTFELYGEDARTPGTYAANCLLARRLAERDVRFVQLFHQGWDQHGGLPGAIRTQCKETDQATAGLLTDLEQRGLLDDTLVIWGGEFGRTNYCQGHLTPTNYGRDHHPRCFSMWMAGGGARGGQVYGTTDDFGYNIAENPVHVHDFQATALHLLGIDHTRLTYKHQGRRFRLTDVAGEVIPDLIG